MFPPKTQKNVDNFLVKKYKVDLTLFYQNQAEVSSAGEQLTKE